MANELLPAAEVDHLPLDRGYLFSPQGVGRRIDATDAVRWLKGKGATQGEFLWLHFSDIPALLTNWHPELTGLPYGLVAKVGEGSRSTRIERVHQSLVAVVNDVDYDFARKGPLEVATLWLAADARCLVSVCSRPLRSVEKLRQEVDAGHAFHGPIALLIRLLRDQAEVLDGIARTAAQTTNEVDIALRAGKLPRRPGLGGIRRDLVRVRRLLAPEPAALFRLVNRPPHWMRDDDTQSLRQSAEEFSVALRDTAGLQERIQLLEEEIAARVAEHTNRIVLILTAVTVIALPINLISGLLGMNIGGLPFRHSESGFWIVVALSLAATTMCAATIFRFRNR